MERAANWPIRVGGEYADKSSLTIYRRVTAIADDLVNYMVCSRGGASSDDFPGEQTASSFRRLHHPEDQSPLPGLIEALEYALDALEHYSDVDENDRANPAMRAAENIIKALAKVNVLVPEEVAA